MRVVEKNFGHALPQVDLFSLQCGTPWRHHLYQQESQWTKATHQPQPQHHLEDQSKGCHHWSRSLILPATSRERGVHKSLRPAQQNLPSCLHWSPTECARRRERKPLSNHLQQAHPSWEQFRSASVCGVL